MSRIALAFHFDLRLRVFAALLSGVLLAVSFPNFSFHAALFVAFAPLIAAVVCSGSLREAFLLGMLFYGITWLINVPWIIDVMAIHGGLALPVGVIIFFAMAVYLSLFGGLFALLVRGLDPLRRPAAWLVVPFVWPAVELLRAHFYFNGFPWNLTASAIVDLAAPIQIVRIVGPYAVSFLAGLPSIWLALALTGALRPRLFAACGAGVAFVLVTWYAVGSRILEAEQRRIEREPREIAALIQPDISQEMRWEASNVFALFETMMSLTRESGARGAKLIIWPESTVPLTYEKTAFYKESIETISRQHGADIILGSVAIDPKSNGRLWNAAYLVSDGKTIGHYDKVKLVPFGEYVPMRKLLFFAEKLVHQVGDFQFGTEGEPLSGHHRYGLAICFEVVFPHVVSRQVRSGSDLLVTITNDAWFGISSAPRQHLDSARLRAVETGRYLLRSATTGISAAADPTGRQYGTLRLGEKGVSIVKYATRSEITPYVRGGDWFAFSCWGVVAVGMVRRKAKSEE